MKPFRWIFYACLSFAFGFVCLYLTVSSAACDRSFHYHLKFLEMTIIELWFILFLIYFMTYRTLLPQLILYLSTLGSLAVYSNDHWWWALLLPNTIKWLTNYGLRVCLCQFWWIQKQFRNDYELLFGNLFLIEFMTGKVLNGFILDATFEKLHLYIFMFVSVGRCSWVQVAHPSDQRSIAFIRTYWTILIRYRVKVNNFLEVSIVTTWPY